MSYGVIYRLPFVDEAGNTKRIDLLQEGYTGSITEADGVGYSPVFTSLEGQNSQKQRTLWGTELVANLFSKTDFEFLNLLKTASEREFRLELYENSTLKHAGYVIPDSVSESYTQAPYGARVGAVSLGALQGIPYKDGSNFYEGRADVLTIVTRCLNKLDFGFDIWDSTNVYEDGMNTGISPLLQADVDQDSFIFDDRGRKKALSCYDVLERVLRSFVVNMFQDNGAWKIIPIELRGQSRTVRRFNSSGVLQETFTHNPSDGSYNWVNGGANLKTLPALREIASVYEHGLIPNLVGNFDFNDGFYEIVTGGGLGESINVPNEWEVSDVNDFTGSLFNASIDRVACAIDNAGPNALFFNSQGVEDGAYVEFESDVSIEGEENDTVLFSLFYAPEARKRIIGSSEPVPDEVVTVPVQIRLGIYYLTAQGTWTTTPTIIEIDDLGDGSSGFTTLASLPVSPIASGFRRFDIASQPIEADGALRVRIYKPTSENQGDSLGDSFGVVAVSEFSVEYFPDGSPQTESRTFVGEREIDSFAQEIDFDINHGDGPTNIHPSAFTVSGSKTESWTRGSLTGGISQVAIKAIAGEAQLPYNVITGTQRTEGTFDRYFTDQGTKYVVSYGQYDERKNYFQGDFVEQFESTTTISISEFEEQQSSSTSGVSGGGQSTNFDNRYFRQSNNLSEGDPSTIRGNIGLGDLAVLDRLPQLTANAGLTFSQGFYDGTQAVLMEADVDDVTIENEPNLRVKDGGISNSKLADNAVTTAKILDENVTNAKLANSTISGKELGTNLDSLSTGTGMTGDAYNGSAERTFATVPASPSQVGHVTTGTQAFGGNKTFEGNLTYEGLIESDNFADVEDFYTGAQLSQDTLKIETIRANELRVKAFVAEISAALYGEDVLTKSRGVLSRDFTIPAVSSSAKLFVEDLEGFVGTPVFEDTDFVRMRVVDRSGGLQVFDVWGNVSGYTDEGDGEQSWNFTRIAGGSATTEDTVFTGSIAIDFGQSGDGVIIRSVIGDNTPRDSVLIWETSPISAANYTLLTRTGNLNGSFGVTTDRYGFGAKDNVIIEVGDSNTMTLGKDAGGSGLHGIHINSENRWYGNGQLEVGGVDGLRFFPSPVFDTSTEVWDSSSAFFDAPLQVGTDAVFAGSLSAASGTFSGELEAVTGSFGEVEIATNGELSGSNWLINETTWVHPVLGDSIFRRSSMADFGSNLDEADVINDDFWRVQSLVDEAFRTTNEESAVKVRATYTKRPTVTTLRLKGVFSVSFPFGENGFGRIEAKIFRSDGTGSTLSNFVQSDVAISKQEFVIDINISSLSDNETHIVELELISFADNQFNNPHIVETSLFSDLNVTTLMQ